MQYRLLTTHYSLLTTHYSLLTTHYSLLTIHYSLTNHYSLDTSHYSLLTTHYSLLTAHCSLLLANRVLLPTLFTTNFWVSTSHPLRAYLPPAYLIQEDESLRRVAGPSSTEALQGLLQVESPWPDSLLLPQPGLFSNGLQLQQEGDTISFEVAALVRSGAVEEGAAPSWLACHCFASYSFRAEALTLVYAVPGAHLAVPGLRQIVWLAAQDGSWGLQAQQRGTLLALHLGEGGVLILNNLSPIATDAFELFCAHIGSIKRLGDALKRPAPAVNIEYELSDLLNYHQLLNQPSAAGACPIGETCNPPMEKRWLMTSIGSSGLILAAQVDGSRIAKLVAVCSLGKVAGGRVPQQGEPPRVVLCGCEQRAEGYELTLELWMPAKSATLPPLSQGLALRVHPCYGDKAVAFVGIVQTSCSFPPSNIRPALPPPPISPTERELLQRVRSALMQTGAAAPFMLRRLIAIFIEERRDLSLAPDSQLIRLLLGHQRSILQPAPVAASSRHSDLDHGRHELVAGMLSSGEQGRSWETHHPIPPILSHLTHPIPSHPIPSPPDQSYPTHSTSP